MDMKKAYMILNENTRDEALMLMQTEEERCKAVSGAVQMALKCMQKEIPQRIITRRRFGDFPCPRCGWVCCYKSFTDNETATDGYCRKCGQKIEWV